MPPGAWLPSATCREPATFVTSMLPSIVQPGAFSAVTPPSHLPVLSASFLYGARNGSFLSFSACALATSLRGSSTSMRTSEHASSGKEMRMLMGMICEVEAGSTYMWLRTSTVR